MQNSIRFSVLIIGIIVAMQIQSTPNVSAQTRIAACKTEKTGMQIITRDANNKLVPNINFIVYTVTKDPDGNLYFDESKKLTSGKTDVGGQTEIFCLDTAKGPYAVKVWESSATYGYFSVSGDQITTKEGIQVVELKMSDLFVIIRDAESKLVKNSYFDIYIQGFDVDGDPIIDETKLNKDKLVTANVNTGDVGGKHMYLAPGSYIVRLHATGNKEYFYIWNQTATSGKTTTVNYKQGTLRTALQNINKKVVREKKIAMYTQKYDAQENPIVGTHLADVYTGLEGKVDAYLPSGEYALKIPSDVSKLFYYIWKVKIKDSELTKVNYRLSGLRLILRNDKGAIVKNAKFSIASQTTDAKGQPVVDKILISGLNTGNGGVKDVYIPTDTYAIIYGKQTIYQVDVADTYFTRVDWLKTITARLNPEVYMTTPFENTNFNLRKTTMPKIDLKDVDKVLSQAYKSEAKIIKKPYSVIFDYTNDQLEKNGVTAEKIRIAFYNNATGKWQYIGKNFPEKHIAIASANVKGTFVLVAQK